MPATGDVLLDTTVVVAHLRGVAAVTQRLAETQTRYLSTARPGPTKTCASLNAGYASRCSCR